MEHILDSLLDEFESIKKQSFLVRFSFLSTILLFNHKSKLNYRILNSKIFKKYSQDSIGCYYYSTSHWSNNSHVQLNESLSIANLCELIRSEILKSIENGGSLYPDNFCTLIILTDIHFIIKIDNNNINLLIEILLDEFNKARIELSNLKNKCSFYRKNISKHDYSTNAVKGNSYYFSISDYIITENREQIVKVGIVNSWSDTVSTDEIYLDISKMDKLIDSDLTGRDFIKSLESVQIRTINNK